MKEEYLWQLLLTRLRVSAEPPASKRGGRKEFIYPDDFPHLREHGGDFYAWQENGIWYIETTLTGKALREKMDGMLPHSHKPFDV